MRPDNGVITQANHLVLVNARGLFCVVIPRWFANLRHTDLLHHGPEGFIGHPRRYLHSCASSAEYSS